MQPASAQEALSGQASSYVSININGYGLSCMSDAERLVLRGGQWEAIGQIPSREPVYVGDEVVDKRLERCCIVQCYAVERIRVPLYQYVDTGERRSLPEAFGTWPDPVRVLAEAPLAGRIRVVYHGYADPECTVAHAFESIIEALAE
ncbi:MAG: hypothetical protein AAFV01_09310 [Bacteroidota bacterium]